MKITVKYENSSVKKAPVSIKIDVPDEECALMVEMDYQQRIETAEDKENIIRRDVQEIMDENFNRPEYNQWHKFDRHRGNPKMLFRRDDEDADDSDGLDTIADYSQEEALNRKYEYEDWCQKIRAALKPEFAEVIIAVILDEKSPEEYAQEIGVHRDTVYKRLQRAKKKFREIF